MITSRKNPLIIELQKMATKPRAEEVLVEGLHLVKELFLCNKNILKILYTSGVEPSQEGHSILQYAADRNIEAIQVSEDCYHKFSQLKSPEGIAAVFSADIITPESIFTEDARLAVADGVQDPGNAGAICRVAEAAGMTGCVFIGGVNPLGGKFLRASMGSAFRLPCVRMSADELCVNCTDREFKIYAADGGNDSVDFSAVSYDAPVAVVLGSEGAGVSEEVRQAATSLIRIPMQGRVESLNVAVAAGIIFYHCKR